MKKYSVKVYDSSDTYLLNWDQELASDPTYVQEINTPACEMSITLARDPHFFNLNGDVEFNNIVRVYVNDLEASDELIFEGYIADYALKYKPDTVEVTLLTYGTELDSFIHELAEVADVSQATGSSTETFGAGKLVAQSFVAVEATLSSVDLKLSTQVETTVNLSIQTNSSGSPSGTTITNGSASKVITNSVAEVIKFVFTTPPALTPASTYWIVLA